MRRSYDDVPKNRCICLLEVILDELLDPARSSFLVRWENDTSDGRPSLYVETTVKCLSTLLESPKYLEKYNVSFQEDTIRSSLRDYFDGFLGILDDRRQSKKGRTAGNWTFGLTLWVKVEPTDEQAVQQARKRENLSQLDLLWQLKVQTLQKSSEQTSIPAFIPRSGATNFVGREKLLTDLHKALRHHQQVALTGMGGIGKTEISIQYAKRYIQNYPGGVCWLYGRDAPNEATLATQIISFARVKLGMDVPETSSNTHERLQYCWAHWPQGNVLLVYDDIDKYSDIYPEFLPTDGRFRILLTTRVQLGPAVEWFPVDVLYRDDSLDLLAFLSKKPDIHNSNEGNNLCEFLGDLPLAVELTGTYLALDSNLSIAELLGQLHQRVENREVMEHEAMGSDYQNDPAWTFTARRGLGAAFDLTWEKLNEATQLLAKMLGRFEAGPIRWRMVDGMHQTMVEQDPNEVAYDPEGLQRSRNLLITYSLLKPFDNRIYRMHPLIREFFRGKTTDEEYAKYSSAD
ncbi:MAG: NB-ARC domain-containing protein [Cyanobacteria bacterium P01_E01_bin.6]